MVLPTESYADLIRLDLHSDAAPETLSRVPLGTSAADGGVDEAMLQDLLFDLPDTLPIPAIDPAYAGAVPVCRELSTPAGYVDALYVNPLGRLTLAEFKLWRNPQARREVIGQILHYAEALASWGYEDLQREVSKTLQRKGNVLYDLVRDRVPGVAEAQFVDNVTRHLKRGEFLLLIVGDGIREDVEHIVGFVQEHSGLHFNLALVEAALYRDGARRLIVQPRVLARTEIVRRTVVEAGPSGDTIVGDAYGEQPAAERGAESGAFWTAVLQDFSFADVTVEAPIVSQGTLYVKVRNSGFNGYGLSFGGFLRRGSSLIGCYLTCRADEPSDVRIYEETEATLEGLREELGSDLSRWVEAGRPRFGFRRKTTFPLVADGGGDFQAAVAWMREHLDLLVSTLHPRLQLKLPA